MVFINEWLPNPTGADAAGEFVELYNDGGQPVALRGWMLQTEKGRTFFLSGKTIGPRGYLKFTKGETKLSLRNIDGGLALYDAGGRLVDRAKFFGSAPEGKSFSRVSYRAEGIEHFIFADPTPGAPNKTVNMTVSVREYPRGVPVNRQLETSAFLAIMVGTAAVLAGLVVYLAKINEDASQLFFGRDEGIGRGAREKD